MKKLITILAVVMAALTSAFAYTFTTPEPYPTSTYAGDALGEQPAGQHFVIIKFKCGSG
jgi:hypothetical protein